MFAVHFSVLGTALLTYCSWTATVTNINGASTIPNIAKNNTDENVGSHIKYVEPFIIPIKAATMQIVPPSLKALASAFLVPKVSIFLIVEIGETQNHGVCSYKCTYGPRQPITHSRCFKYFYRDSSEEC